MSIEFETKAYGWEGTLRMLNEARNNPQYSLSRRQSADRNFKRINAKLHDPKLMSLRERLIRASTAGDEDMIKSLTSQIRYYEHEDQETGLY